MGWKAITKNFEILTELNEDGSGTGLGRPVDAGNNNELLAVAQEAYGHAVYVDLTNGIIVLDYSAIGIQNGTIEVHNPRTVLTICDETSIVGELQHTFSTDPDVDGNFFTRFEPLIWRPIWFMRHIDTLPGGPIQVIGAQTTLPITQGERNVKLFVSLFPDGRVGISG